MGGIVHLNFEKPAMMFMNVIDGATWDPPTRNLITQHNTTPAD